jgi:hypothetical protein
VLPATDSQGRHVSYSPHQGPIPCQKGAEYPPPSIYPMSIGLKQASVYRNIGLLHSAGDLMHGLPKVTQFRWCVEIDQLHADHSTPAACDRLLEASVELLYGVAS